MSSGAKVVQIEQNTKDYRIFLSLHYSRPLSRDSKSLHFRDAAYLRGLPQNYKKLCTRQNFFGKSYGLIAFCLFITLLLLSFSHMKLLIWRIDLDIYFHTFFLRRSNALINANSRIIAQNPKNSPQRHVSLIEPCTSEKKCTFRTKATPSI